MANMEKTKNNVAAERAAGASAGGLATERPVACKYIKQWIDDLRSDMYMAVALDKFIEMINGYLDTIGEKDEITKEDVKTCIRYDDTVKIMDVNGKEVLWLWGGWRLHDLIRRVAEVAAKESEVSAAAGI